MRDYKHRAPNQNPFWELRLQQGKNLLTVFSKRSASYLKWPLFVFPLFVIVVSLLIDFSASEANISSTGTVKSSRVRELPIPALPTMEDALESAPATVLKKEIQPIALVETEKKIYHRVSQGEVLSAIFERRKLGIGTLYRILRNKQVEQQFKRIQPGNEVIFTLNEAGLLDEIEVKLSRTHSFVVSSISGSDTLKSGFKDYPTEAREVYAQSVIDSSLFLSAKKAGVSDGIIMELVNVFGWDVDFARDIRAGDSFRLIYQEIYLNDERIGEGAILVAEFINQKRVFKAVRYEDDQGRTGYYSPDGKSLRKAFLKSPVEFSRISSRFNLKRKHPVLNRIRAHKGVDYAASTGTPIRTTADGRIIHRGRKGGYGRSVIIQHVNGISTLYAHMSKYRSGQKVGSRVSQGNTIGYVGKSGLATGPHLHYEMRVNGRHKNPLRMKFPSARPIAKKYKQEFSQHAKVYLERMESIGLAIDQNLATSYRFR